MNHGIMPEVMAYRDGVVCVLDDWIERPTGSVQPAAALPVTATGETKENL